MGRGYIEYTLTTTGRTEFVAYSAFLTYRLPDGSALDIDQQPAWCPGCNGFVLAERLPDVVELEHERAAVQSGEPERMRRFTLFGRSAGDVADELYRRIAWRRGRRSPPRCLLCGSTRVTPVPGDDRFAHPATGEPVVVTGGGFASMPRWVEEFTPEGEPLVPRAAGQQVG